MPKPDGNCPARRESRDESAPPATLRVLVVDDEPLIRWSISEALTASGHSVRAVDTADAALRLLAGNGEPFDVVLLDYCLPDSQGLGLLATIRRMSPGTVLVMITCDSTPEMVHDARSLGAARVISKPFDMNDLPRLVHDLYISHAG